MQGGPGGGGGGGGIFVFSLPQMQHWTREALQIETVKLSPVLCHFLVHSIAFPIVYLLKTCTAADSNASLSPSQ